MIKISGAKINEISAEIDGKTFDNIKFTRTGDPEGIAASFSVDTSNEELAMAALKKFLKEKYPVLRIYVEII